MLAGIFTEAATMSHWDTQRCDRDNRGLVGASRLGPEPSLSFRTELTLGRDGWEENVRLKELVCSHLT